MLAFDPHLCMLQRPLHTRKPAKLRGSVTATVRRPLRLAAARRFQRREACVYTLVNAHAHTDHVSPEDAAILERVNSFDRKLYSLFAEPYKKR